MIQRLFNLYEKAPNPFSKPTERFVSEGLVGVLENDEELLDRFLQEVCKVKFNGAKLTTEESYRGGKSYIDIQIEEKNGPQLLFIEVKVDSGLGNRQLEKYQEILASLEEKKIHENTFLIYLTRDHVQHPELSQLYEHISWTDVSKFFKKYREDNSLVDSYLTFLNNLRLGPMKTLNEEDIESLKNYVDLYEKIYGMLQVMKLKFNKKYNDYSFSEKQVLENKRLLIFKKNIFPEDSYSEIGLGLYFLDQPKIRAHIYIQESEGVYKNFVSTIKTNWPNDIEKYSNGISIYFTENLDSLVNTESPKDKLEAIVDSLFSNLDEVINKTSNIDWRLN